jgi:hypothetical protein
MAEDTGLTDRQRSRVGALRVAFELAGDDDLDRVKDLAEFIVADDYDEEFDEDEEEAEDEEPEDEEPEEEEPPKPRKRAAKKQ